MKTKTCPDCKSEISPNNYKRHIGSKQCLHNQKTNNRKSTKIEEDWLLPNGKYQCPHCQKEYTKNGIGTHIWRAHGDGQDWTGNNDERMKEDSIWAPWNKGLTKEDHPKIKQSRDKFSQRYKNGEIEIHNTHNDESKKKISESMKKAHKEGRAHNIGQSRWNNEMSYPEKFFTKVIENEFNDKNYTNEFPVGIYSIDFAWVDKKLAIEIDGDQHEKPDYKARDKRKDKKLTDEGWKVLRIKWKDLFNNTKEWIEIAKDFVH